MRVGTNREGSKYLVAGTMFSRSRIRRKGWRVEPRARIVRGAGVDERERTGSPIWTKAVLKDATLYEMKKGRRALKALGVFARLASSVIWVAWGAFLGVAWAREWTILLMTVVVPPLVAVGLYKAGLIATIQSSLMHLEVAADGIAFSVAGWHLVAPWTAFTGTGRVSRLPFSQRGLLLAEPVVSPNSRGRWLGIPLDLFDPSWRNGGPLGQEIRRYAPQILDPAPRMR